ncbi:class D sortase [Paenibacillus sp. Marseille-P2973]|uniref:class D sortase n=1 Tax=Paenibacillus sp. Marseille-P2973 TaxID=1871032 RepID=UPI001B375BE9|nr:class D sortase [Paenibacillus sp. Marseille-P2973]MBQ4902056.1 class D sortase [Paenibacillus sp. Marseille-P2973]
MRKMAYFLIGIGILIILFPKTTEWIQDSKQQRLLEDAANSLNTPRTKELINQDLRNEYLVMSRALDTELVDADTEVRDALDQNSDRTVSQPAEKKDKNQAIAVIKISKIDLELPVLEGATKTNMKYAAAHMKETTDLGEEGNAAIAAHRSHTKGRLFNRLNEVEVGDEILIEVKEGSYVYTVDKISVVKPTDVSVLDVEDPEERVLTLITCDPLINPTHRLIVRAKM